MSSSDIKSLGSFLWSIAELLRGDFKQSEYGKVVLPFVVLRRLDCILEETKGYAGLRALVAFSGDLTIDGTVWTEATANGFAETELPKKFDTDEYQVLVVAEKYQTGFDQPKLVAMYVDKKLAGLQAVQTLARLNRSYGKDKPTYVLDFQNSMEDIREAFAPFFEATALEERTDLNQIYDLEQRITNTTYVQKDEVERFADQFFKGELTTQDRLALEGTVRLVVERFNLDEDEAQQEEFRLLLKSFLRFYAFVAQVVSLNDAWLEKLYAYSAWLSRLLPSRDMPADIAITDDMLTLSAFKLQKGEEGSASLAAGETATLAPITSSARTPIPRRRSGRSRRSSIPSTSAMARASRVTISSASSASPARSWTRT